MIIRHKLNEKASYASPFFRQVSLACNTPILVASGGPLNVSPQAAPIQAWQIDTEALDC